MNEGTQLEFLRDIFPRFRDEYSQFPAKPTSDPAEFYLENPKLSGADPLVLYCMIRHFRPRLILEVGSGYSTLVSAKAARANGDTELISIEPYPPDFLTSGIPGLSSMITKKVQDLDLAFFDRLGPGDILFIDSSHVARYGSDVNYLYLEVLPRLNPGVVVHSHDIFLPGDYPASWLTDHLLFLSEQYLLQAFLAFNSDFEVFLSNSYLTANRLDDLQSTFPMATPYPGGASFWMKRKE